MRRKKSDEIDAALRADPDYKELCALLDKQTTSQKRRLEERLAQEEGDAVVTPPELPKKDKQSEKPSPAIIPPEWVAGLRELIREELRTMLAENRTAISTGMDAPPLTPRKEGSKEYRGERETLPGCRVDAVLFDRFEEERNKTGISASELMQRILWNAFGKPPLSFETSEDSDK